MSKNSNNSFINNTISTIKEKLASLLEWVIDMLTKIKCGLHSYIIEMECTLGAVYDTLTDEHQRKEFTEFFHINKKHRIKDATTKVMVTKELAIDVDAALNGLKAQCHR